MATFRQGPRTKIQAMRRHDGAPIQIMNEGKKNPATKVIQGIKSEAESDYLRNRTSHISNQY